MGVFLYVGSWDLCNEPEPTFNPNYFMVGYCNSFPLLLNYTHLINPDPVMFQFPNRSLQMFQIYQTDLSVPVNYSQLSNKFGSVR